ncbi:hypothetical protein LLB_2059 [Legionella longbeachae D-4968]|nr:hypothetical protein LLB_2059 [Legionella longbeachae D-4968]
MNTRLNFDYSNNLRLIVKDWLALFNFDGNKPHNMFLLN